MIEQVAELCQGAKAGDSEAASELVNLFYERVYAYFRRLCGNDQDAEDLTQKTFVKVWAALGSFQGRSNFSTWIHGVGHHVYVDWRRSKRPFDIQTDEWGRPAGRRSVCGGPEQGSTNNVSQQHQANRTCSEDVGE
jgi:RNA polymerase sigma factor (sigma-70 family)